MNYKINKIMYLLYQKTKCYTITHEIQEGTIR